MQTIKMLFAVGTVAAGFALSHPRALAADAAGAALFKAKCAMCHGPDGAGQTPMGKKLNIPNMGSARVQDHSDAELTEIILKGKGNMKPVGVKPDQVPGLISVIRSFKK
jgi:mono/diheme cytochrome c family protein